MVSKQGNEDDVTAEGVVAIWSCSSIFKKWYVCTTYNSICIATSCTNFISSTICIFKMSDLSSNYYSSCEQLYCSRHSGINSISFIIKSTHTMCQVTEYIIST